MPIPIKGPKPWTSSLVTVAKGPALEKCPEYFACEPGSLLLPGWDKGYSKGAHLNTIDHAVVAKSN